MHFYRVALVLDGDYLQVLDGATKIIDSLKSRQPDATSHNIDRWRAGREAGNRHPVSGSRVGVAFFQIDECHLWRWHVLCYFLSYSQSTTPGLARTRALEGLWDSSVLIAVEDKGSLDLLSTTESQSSSQNGTDALLVAHRHTTKRTIRCGSPLL